MELKCRRQSPKSSIWWIQKPKERYSLLGAQGTELSFGILSRWRTMCGWEKRFLVFIHHYRTLTKISNKNYETCLSTFNRPFERRPLTQRTPWDSKNLRSNSTKNEIMTHHFWQLRIFQRQTDIRWQTGFQAPKNSKFGLEFNNYDSAKMPIRWRLLGFKSSKVELHFSNGVQQNGSKLKITEKYKKWSQALIKAKIFWLWTIETVVNT